MDTLIDTAIMGILDHWEKYPDDLKEEIEQRKDILGNDEVKKWIEKNLKKSLRVFLGNL